MTTNVVTDSDVRHICPLLILVLQVVCGPCFALLN